MVQALLFFAIALLYASVGFGGGSGYIAILSFYNFEPSQLRFIALCCNILVVSGGTWLFLKKRVVHFKKIVPFIVGSVPAALIGGAYQMESKQFFTLLAIALLVAGMLMLIQLKKVEQNIDRRINSPLLSGTIGAVIGLVSGLVGIGGGIFLAPVLHLLHWDKPKVIAATASFFILVNSVSGLIGQLSFNTIEISWKLLIPFLLAVLIGGQIGSRINISWLSQKWIKAFTALLVIFASVRMIVNVL